jgi:hypothetical protein
LVLGQGRQKKTAKTLSILGDVPTCLAVNPIPILPINTVNSLLPTIVTGRPQKVCWIANAVAQTAVWGRGQPSDPCPGVL